MERAAWIILFIAVLIALESREPKVPPPPSPMDAATCHCGLDKLSDGELAVLGKWIGQPINRAREDKPSIERPRIREPQTGEVIFNTNSRKYHCPSCSHARQCTRNCIPLSLREALERGGIPCGSCGGCG